MRAQNRGNYSSSYQRRPGSNYQPSSRRYSNRREAQDTYSHHDHTHSYYETSSTQPNFSQPPPSTPIDVSKSNLSAEAAVFVPRFQQNCNVNNITTDQNYSLPSQQYVIIYQTTEQISDQFSVTHHPLQHVPQEQFATYVDESHTTEPSASQDDNCEENVYETEEKPLELDSNVDDNGIEEVSEQHSEQVDCEQKTENDETKKDENLGNREQKQRTNYRKTTQRRRNVHSLENDTKSDDRKNNNHSKDDVKHSSKRNTETHSFVRHHSARSSRGESGSFRRSQRKDNDGKPSEKERENKPPGLKSVHFQLPQPEIPTVPQSSTFRSFSQVLKSGKPADMVDSVSLSPQSSGIPDTVDSLDTEIEQDNSKAWKKESNRPSNRPKLNFVEMPLGEDLFSAPDTFSLAHCVGADFRMGMGIATIFKKKFQRVDELKKSKTKIGGVASLQDGNRFIFYLVTKEKSNIDPYFDDLQASLIALRDECLRLGIRKLAIPRLGCGLDKLQWDEVRNEVQKIFADIEMEIRVYFIPYSKSAEPTS